MPLGLPCAASLRSTELTAAAARLVAAAPRSDSNADALPAPQRAR